MNAHSGAFFPFRKHSDFLDLHSGPLDFAFRPVWLLRDTLAIAPGAT
jgi:hypothetical protein